MNTPENLPLSGLLVLELANVLAGPSVGQFLAELGAEVLKLENLATDGDVTRKWKLGSEPTDTDVSAYFSCVNWGKKSVAINLKQPEALELVHRLARQADVVLASYKPGDAGRLKVDFSALQQLNPRLIYGEITGYGPHVNRAGYDAVLQAETGFMHLNGQPDGPPTKMPVALIDLLAGHQLKEGILTALYLRERTGKGQRVQVTLQAAAVASLANQATNWLVAGHNPQRMGSEHPNIVPYGALYSTSDGRQLTLAVGDNRQFAALCEVLGIPTTATDSRFSSNSARVQHRQELQELLQERISGFQLADLLPQLVARHVPAGAVNDVATVLSDPANQDLLLQPGPEHQNLHSGLRNVAFGLGSSAQVTHLAPPPHLGQHTAEVLQQKLGLSEEQISRLKEQQAVG